MDIPGSLLVGKNQTTWFIRKWNIGRKWVNLAEEGERGGAIVFCEFANISKFSQFLQSLEK